MPTTDKFKLSASVAVCVANLRMVEKMNLNSRLTAGARWLHCSGMKHTGTHRSRSSSSSSDDSDDCNAMAAAAAMIVITAMEMATTVTVAICWRQRFSGGVQAANHQNL